MLRRDFLLLAASAALPMSSGTARTQPTFSTNPFTLGVASGDPLPNGVVLWTRLAPDPLHGGGMGPDDVKVRWEVYDDDAAKTRVLSGEAVAFAKLAHSVHVEVEGLEPNRWYWYRFLVGSEESPLGRTRTAPEPTSAQPFRFAFVSCQNYEHGFFTAYDHLSHEDIGFIAHLGDYIYEKGAHKGNFPRYHPPETTVTLEQYRLRYAWYKKDPDLQKAHVSFPWIVTPDDHEVGNNYAGDYDEYGTPPKEFLIQRAAAYQAYYEHMPLRHTALPHMAAMRLYRRIRFGSLATFHVLDTRQFRSDQPCGDRLKKVCDGALDPRQTMMGQAQEAWLQAGLDQSTARWNVLAQQVLMAEVNWNPKHQPVLENMDKWDGYHAARDRLFQFLASRKPTNPVVLTGDIHSNWVNDLKADFLDPRSATLSTEFAGTSISSGGDRPDKHLQPDQWLPNNPHVRFYNNQRGYVLCEVNANEWRTNYRVLDYVTRPGSPIKTAASFVVQNGRAGAERA